MHHHIASLLTGLALISALDAGQKVPAPTLKKEADKPPRIVLVIHGGAGVMSEEEMKTEGLTRRDFEKPLAEALAAGYKALQGKDKTSVDAVEAAIRVLEDSERFNAGRGAVFTSDGRVELDASIMEGRMEGRGEGKADPRKRAGAVTGVTHVKNPISAARAIMEMEGSRHVLLSGDPAELFVLSPENSKKYKIERVSNLYFWTDRRLRQVWKPKPEATVPGKAGASARAGTDGRMGTVGAVALDRRGMLAAGTSTGGLTNKMPGRVGDTPIVGAGTYADDRACGVSCTGTGEVFMRHVVAHDVVARMRYGGRSLKDAVKEAIADLPDQEGGVGGLIALDREGRHAFGMSDKLVGMYRGYVTQDGKIHVALYAAEQPVEVKTDPKSGR